jgi:hypothetical protein
MKNRIEQQRRAQAGIASVRRALLGAALCIGLGASPVASASAAASASTRTAAGCPACMWNGTTEVNEPGPLRVAPRCLYCSLKLSPGTDEIAPLRVAPTCPTCGRGVPAVA